MDNNFKLAPLGDNHDIVDDISRFEHELKQKTGKDIVLIAYTMDANR
jgi:hypothetical protein